MISRRNAEKFRCPTGTFVRFRCWWIWPGSPAQFAGSLDGPGSSSSSSFKTAKAGDPAVTGSSSVSTTACMSAGAPGDRSSSAQPVDLPTRLQYTSASIPNISPRSKSPKVELADLECMVMSPSAWAFRGTSRASASASVPGPQEKEENSCS